MPFAQAPAIRSLSVDGAMVSLRHQEGAEVKTLAIGAVDKLVCEGASGWCILASCPMFRG
jgi:hypothetical protein